MFSAGVIKKTRTYWIVVLLFVVAMPKSREMNVRWQCLDVANEDLDVRRRNLPLELQKSDI
jgi:hypothetical protein